MAAITVRRVPAHRRRAGLFFSLVCHAALFIPLPLGRLFFRQAQYEVEPDLGGMEICLVAPPPAEATRGREAGPAVVPAAEMPASNALLSSDRAAGDGRAPRPGTDPTTATIPANSQVDAKSGTLKNRAPQYPELARRLAQEGRVFLSVRVDKEGLPIRVEVEKSSGYPLLDEAALGAVRKWEFRPARSGFVPVDSIVRVPIRFKLEKE